MTTPTQQLFSDPSPAHTSRVQTNTAKKQTCPVFTLATLQRQLAVDTAIRWTVITLVVAYLLFGPQLEAVASTWSTLAAFALIVIWIAMGVLNTRTAAKLPKITAMITQNPQAAESTLAETIGKRPLSSTVRLLLYHRLAMLRMHQQRFAETAAICHAVLSQKSKIAETPRLAHNAQPASNPDSPSWLSSPTVNQQTRTNLLLMLTEARLQCGDLTGAYIALRQLHDCRLSLIDRLQLMPLQTRYEIAVGYHTSALRGIHQKIQLAELLPAPQCGLMHALLATAANQAHQVILSDWLIKRAKLLCTPEQLQAVKHFPVGSIPPSSNL